jgi:phospholipid transport system transporter-binding protein
MVSLALPASLTVSEAHAVLATLSAGITSDTSATVAIDASALTTLDTAAVATLLECRRVAERLGRRIELQGVPPRLLSLARLYGVADLIGISPSGLSGIAQRQRPA